MKHRHILKTLTYTDAVLQSPYSFGPTLSGTRYDGIYHKSGDVVPGLQNANFTLYITLSLDGVELKSVGALVFVHARALRRSRWCLMDILEVLVV